MKIKQVLASLFLVIGMMSLLGGCSMTEEKVNYKKEQDRMVEYLASHYEGIEKVEFRNFEKNNTTGTWNSDAVVNDIYYITFNLNGLGEEIDIAEHISRSKGKELNLKNEEKDVNVSQIKKIYFEE
ncbi:DUF1433 domain-containing protein [Streptococcus ruminantium]|uniref:DUF1433 domain-containing protein n=1 Tax=Streptococcus ruminantium TaxID=1917441 RepID=UPI001D13D3EF|nr:DUF1433 domain-containing protein [Streptococcus ruminantium]